MDVSRLLEKKLSRRRFLGLSSCALAGVAAAHRSGPRALAKTERSEADHLPGRNVFTSCGMCVNKCGDRPGARRVIHKLVESHFAVKPCHAAPAACGVKVVYD
jgi:thiosulfate reductase/polysulfide reductase chain A